LSFLAVAYWNRSGGFHHRQAAKESGLVRIRKGK
jgi:hypothetical protein